MLALLVAATIALSGTAGSSLKITVWPNGPTDASYTRTLRCAPPGGTLRGAAEACRRLDAMRSPFAPVPKESVCTQIWGGPAEARVTGTYRGRRIWARLTRRDGCEIGRWKQHSFLFAR